jgi:hypothetical protein
LGGGGGGGERGERRGGAARLGWEGGGGKGVQRRVKTKNVEGALTLSFRGNAEYSFYIMSMNSLELEYPFYTLPMNSLILIFYNSQLQSSKRNKN